MKRLSIKAMRTKNQKGIDVVDAIFAMIIASMIASAMLNGLGNWFSVRTQTANQDAANQHAQGVIAKTSSVDWASLGFKASQNSPALPEGSGFTDAASSCPTVYRGTAKIGDKEYKTVTSADSVAGVTQTSVAELRGKKYCVITDVTWGDQNVASTYPSSSYGTKNISVKVSWDDRGTPRSISVNSTRSPNIGEAIPSGISEGAPAEASPLKSFDITRAYHDGTSPRICYKGDWSDTSDTVKFIGAANAGLSGDPQTTVPLTATDRLQEKCLAISPVNYSHYGLIVSDAAGVKFRSVADYQFPGSKLTYSGNSINWNTYPSAGTTKYRIMRSASADFSSPTQVAEITNSTYTLTSGGIYYVRVDTINSDYTVTANSNVVAVNIPG